MQSKKLRSFKPVLGFAKAQIHSFLFSGLIFAVLMVAITFAMGSNPLFEYRVSDISYKDPLSIEFGLIIACASFIFAGFTFKPFMSKNESDTFLSLPIKKSQLLTFQIMFGLVSIIIASLLSFAVIYPAMNISKFSDSSYYMSALKSMLFDIIIPMLIFYLLAVSLILRTRNFFSSFLSFATILAASFFCGSYIISNIGQDTLGVNYYDFTFSTQTFYYNSSIFLPTKTVFIVLKALFGLNSAAFDPSVIMMLINLFFVGVSFLLFLLSVKKISLGDLGKPFSPLPLLKYLPICALIALVPILMFSAGTVSALIAAAAGFLLISVLSFVFIRKKQLVIKSIAATLVALIIPFSMPLCNNPVTQRLTYELPAASDVSAVYFNAVYAAAAADYDASGAAYKTLNYNLAGEFNQHRYKFSNRETIQLVIETQKQITDRIKNDNLLYESSVKYDEGLTIAVPDKLTFNHDDYAVYREEHAKEDIDEWGIFEQQDLSLDYFTYLYDIESNIETEAENNPPVYGNDVIDYKVEEIPTYEATFYYQLNDGRWFFRTYNQLPVSWIKDAMIKVMTSEEYIKKVSNYYTENYSDPFYLSQAASISDNKGMYKDFNFSSTEQIAEFYTAMFIDDITAVKSDNIAYRFSFGGTTYDITADSKNLIGFIDGITGQEGDNNG